MTCRFVQCPPWACTKAGSSPSQISIQEGDWSALLAAPCGNCAARIAARNHIIINVPAWVHIRWTTEVAACYPDPTAGGAGVCKRYELRRTLYGVKVSRSAACYCPASNKALFSCPAPARSVPLFFCLFVLSYSILFFRLCFVACSARALIGPCRLSIRGPCTARRPCSSARRCTEYRRMDWLFCFPSSFFLLYLQRAHYVDGHSR